MTSLRRDSTRVQNGWTDGSRPTAPLPAPPFLIYARRYLCQRIYILIFIIRNIIARAFIALVEKPRTARFAIQLTRGSLARSFSPPFLPSPVRGSLSTTAIASSTTVPLSLSLSLSVSKLSYLLSNISSRRRRLLLVPLFLSFPFFLSRIRYHEKAALGRPRERKKEKRKLLEAVSGKKFLGIVARVPRKRRGGGGQCEIIVLLGRVSLN